MVGQVQQWTSHTSARHRIFVPSSIFVQGVFSESRSQATREEG